MSDRPDTDIPTRKLSRANFSFSRVTLRRRKAGMDPIQQEDTHHTQVDAAVSLQVTRLLHQLRWMVQAYYPSTSISPLIQPTLTSRVETLCPELFFTNIHDVDFHTMRPSGSIGQTMLPLFIQVWRPTQPPENSDLMKAVCFSSTRVAKVSTWISPPCDPQNTLHYPKPTEGIT